MLIGQALSYKDAYLKGQVSTLVRTLTIREANIGKSVGMQCTAPVADGLHRSCAQRCKAVGLVKTPSPKSRVLPSKATATSLHPPGNPRLSKAAPKDQL
jgi:hypothetical protein